MESVLWDLRAVGQFSPGETYLMAVFFTVLMFWEFPLLLVYALLTRASFGKAPRRDPRARPLAVLVVIPSLLRKRDELTSMMSTIQSVAANGYPGELTIVVSIDGTADAPSLHAELCAWARQQRWNDRTALHVTGTPVRRSKAMAIDHAIAYVKDLVADGVLREFPPLYVSTDADADLGPSAIEAIAYRLQRRNRFTGAPARVVAGALHVRNNAFWRGWRYFFTVPGQLELQVARDYYVSNLARYNVRALPVTGVPGAFYCTWSEIFLAIPRFVAHARTLRLRDWLAWWAGAEPPRLSGSRIAPLPERVAGDTDDTVTAYVATMARWENGRFTFDAPRSPLHAAWYLLRTLLLDRPIQYEPQARVFTSSPNTVKALFKQRKRWNSARLELTMRLWRALAFHWGMGGPALLVKSQMAKSLLVGMFVYFYLPFVAMRAHFLTAVVAAYACQVAVAATLTAAALLVTGELHAWRLALALPLCPVYFVGFKWLPGAVGQICDVFLFGNVTGFAPEWTLKRGKSVRIALLFRLRRAFLLAVRAVTRGDVPFGAFWFGWGETPWTPSGFEGWTTGKKPRPILPLPEAWGRREPPPRPVVRPHLVDPGRGP